MSLSFTRSVSSPVLRQMEYAQLRVFVEAETETVFRILYAGYPLLLSGMEGRLLLLLVQAALGEDPLADLDDVVSRMEASTADAVRIYVRRINEKAREISGRKLILSERPSRFRLNPWM